jgi:hypothetical protein
LFIKAKTKELKRQKQEKENCFTNLKERETHSGVTSPSLDDCTAREEDLTSMNGLHSMKLEVVNARQRRQKIVLMTLSKVPTRWDSKCRVL